MKSGGSAEKKTRKRKKGRRNNVGKYKTRQRQTDRRTGSHPVSEEKGALDEEHAVGYDQLKNIKLTTQVLAYTIANLMQEKVVIRTDDDRYYFSEVNWARLERKVLGSYSFLFIIPLVAAIIFYFVSKYI